MNESHPVHDSSSHVSANQSTTDRRNFVSRTSSVLMAGGVIAGYGTAGVMAVEFLYPTASQSTTGWQFACTVDQLQKGNSMTYIAPSGAKVVIARQGDGDTADDFIALSSVCPHLGCQVHWEAQNNRFFCPCHNGAFDPQGNPIAGPPKQGNQQLTRFPLRVENGLLYIEAPLTSVGRRVAADHRDRGRHSESVQEA